MLSDVLTPSPTRDEDTVALRAEANEFEEESLRTSRKDIAKDLPQFIEQLKAEAKNSLLPKDRIRAIREICLMAGMYVEQVKHSGEVKNIQVFIPEADGGSKGNRKELACS